MASGTAPDLLLKQVSMQNRLFIGFLLIVVLAMSCSKKGGVTEPTPVPGATYQYMNTGTILHDVTRVYAPGYWLDEKRYELPFADAIHGFAYGIEQVNQDLYIAGAFTPKPGVSDKDLLPCYWKNGVKYNLPTAGLPDFMTCSAKDLRMLMGVLYIIGNIDYNPVLWKVDQTGAASLVPIPDDASTVPGGSRSGSNLVVGNNKLYFCGDQVALPGAHYESSIGYWELEPGKAVQWHPLKYGMAYATAFSMTIRNNQVYIAGEYSMDFSGATPAGMALWKGGELVNLAPISNPAAIRMNEVHTDQQGNLYANVYDFETHRPLAYKVTGESTVQPIQPIIPAGVRGYCSSVAIADGHVGYSGYYFDNTKRVRLWNWINGQLQELEIPGGHASANITFARWVRK
jgi:hypothetical protein